MSKRGVSLVPAERVERSIILVRGQKVMLDSSLAVLYNVPTSRLNEAVKRNRGRFPSDFMFQLSKTEHALLLSQFAISKKGRGGRRRPPYVFTEQGVAMLSSVLHSERAVRVNIEIMRTFVRLREILSSHKELAQKLAEMEEKYDKNFRAVFEAIRKLIETPVKKSQPIGFIT
ncbi:MAG TPA: ORF6N domain-containing protein [Candidatus Paceibacterota bacterium]|nr:ORF6N domain-containing protein [Candidatus Paceibacterota bacterium]